jgi:ANTAR domain
MMETESDQAPEAGDSRRHHPQQYESDEPAAWPSDAGAPRVASEPRAPGGARPGPDGHGRPRPERYDQQAPDGFGQQRPDGHRQQRPDAYDQGRPDGHRQQRPDRYGRPEPDGYGRPRPDRYDQQQSDAYRGRHSPTAVTTDGQRRTGGDGTHGDGAGQYRLADPPVARRTPTGWRVGDEEVSDLTSAMVLADLLAAELPAEGPPTPGGQAASAASRRRAEEPPPNVRQLQETVAQLEHALTVRVRVEQAIGVLAERHRLRPRQAFEMLRSAARSRGRRVLEVAGEVVESASNPLLRLPEELAKPPVARRRGRASRRPRDGE